MLGMQMSLVGATRMVQKLSMHKRCPDCGADNDLGGMYRSSFSAQIIPLCGSCGTFLWKRLPGWKKWLEKRRS